MHFLARATIARMIKTEHFKEKLLVEQKTLAEELGAIAIFNTETNMWEATPDQDLIGETDDNAEMAVAETELLNLCSEANLYVETTTTQSLHQWYAAMSYFDLMASTQTEAVAAEAE